MVKPDLTLQLPVLFCNHSINKKKKQSNSSKNTNTFKMARYIPNK